jgi:hypothetical protein
VVVVDRQEIVAAFEDVFDQAIVFHGFAAHMRDYDVFIYATADPRTGIPPEHLRYRFTHCVRATATTAVRRDVWKRSLDDRLLEYQRYVEADDLEGYVWGVNWQGLYPGMALLEESAEAAQWADDVGVPFHEARIETNGHNLELIFSDLLITRVEPGFAPFAVPHGGPDFKIPLA